MQPRGIAAVLRLRLEHHAILVRLGVDGRNLPLAEGVVERVAHRLHGDAEAPGHLAIDFDARTQADIHRLEVDVAQ